MHRQYIKTDNPVAHAICEKLLEKLGVQDLEGIRAFDLAEP